MKTIEERAQDLLSTLTGLKREDKLQLIILALKDQDKITRKECADNILMASYDCETATGEDALRRDKCVRLIINANEETISGKARLFNSIF